ncbi:unnamed protein product [Agarophyton chilense]
MMKVERGDESRAYSALTIRKFAPRCNPQPRQAFHIRNPKIIKQENRSGECAAAQGSKGISFVLILFINSALYLLSPGLFKAQLGGSLSCDERDERAEGYNGNRHEDENEYGGASISFASGRKRFC